MAADLLLSSLCVLVALLTIAATQAVLALRRRDVTTGPRPRRP